MKSDKIKIAVCYYDNNHFGIPKDEIFLPLQAGKKLSKVNLNILGDDTGDNISEKNKTFGEYSAWYWVWKNIKKLYPQIEYAGLAHYRRFFALDRKTLFIDSINIKKLPDMSGYGDIFIKELQNCDMIRIKRLVFPYNRIVQFSRSHDISNYFCIKQIVQDLHPEYIKSFNHIFENTNRMSIPLIAARYEILDDYFSWLFPILFEAERRIDVSKYSNYQKRIFAFLAERLTDVYTYHNKLKESYKPMYFICKRRNKSKEILDLIKNILSRIIFFISGMIFK
jgi:hypothetical protein